MMPVARLACWDMPALRRGQRHQAACARDWHMRGEGSGSKSCHNVCYLSSGPEDPRDDPVHYETTDSSSPFLIESQIDMSRRFFTRGLKHPSPWRRNLVRSFYVVFLGLLVIGVISLIVNVVQLVVD
jgi:hypothetical protein